MITSEIFNQGEDLPPLKEPDNESSFLLSEDELAFINAVNMQLTVIKMLTVSIVTHVEDQMALQCSVVSALKDQFIMAMTKKHSLDTKKFTDLSIDVENKLFVAAKGK